MRTYLSLDPNQTTLRGNLAVTTAKDIVVKNFDGESIEVLPVKCRKNLWVETDDEDPIVVRAELVVARGQRYVREAHNPWFSRKSSVAAYEKYAAACVAWETRTPTNGGNFDFFLAEDDKGLLSPKAPDEIHTERVWMDATGFFTVKEERVQNVSKALWPKGKVALGLSKGDSAVFRRWEAQVRAALSGSGIAPEFLEEGVQKLLSSGEDYVSLKTETIPAMVYVGDVEYRREGDIIIGEGGDLPIRLNMRKHLNGCKAFGLE